MNIKSFSLSFGVGLVVAVTAISISSMSACTPAQTAEAKKITSVVVTDVVDVGENVCAVVQPIDGVSIPVQEVCAAIDQWGPLIEHVLAAKKLRAARMLDASAAPAATR